MNCTNDHTTKTARELLIAYADATAHRDNIATELDRRGIYYTAATAAAEHAAFYAAHGTPEKYNTAGCRCIQCDLAKAAAETAAASARRDAHAAAEKAPSSISACNPNVINNIEQNDVKTPKTDPFDGPRALALTPEQIKALADGALTSSYGCHARAVRAEEAWMFISDFAANNDTHDNEARGIPDLVPDEMPAAFELAYYRAHANAEEDRIENEEHEEALAAAERRKNPLAHAVNEWHEKTRAAEQAADRMRALAAKLTPDARS